MTTLSDAAQFERDLRAARTEWKHQKDHVAKWAYGTRPLYGVRVDWNGNLPAGSTLPESVLSKARPCRKPKSKNSGVKPHNFVKPGGRLQYYTPLGRQRVACHVLAEMQDATSALMARRAGNPNAFPEPARVRSGSLSSSSSALSSSSAAADPFIYSFDCTESPNRPLTLEVFVKPSGVNRHGGRGGRNGGLGGETERLVEREYEVVDGNGEPVRGRRVRAILRKEERGRRERKGESGDGGVGAEERWEEDEGFELI
ncbi:hypothetical protein VTJ83DRAFT_4824 [Remersonia thermophila]|uniref:Uncharacterized protein n=1 Tax=Remersonia thermophila TaxID=72144 RepID=A0ABR4DB16_9PEZI